MVTSDVDEYSDNIWITVSIECNTFIFNAIPTITRQRFQENTKTPYLTDVSMDNNERTLHPQAVTYIRQNPTLSKQPSQQNTKLS